jgi:hypothetical protein
MQDQRDQLDKWADMWEKSLKDGVFKDAPRPPVPGEQTADVSYFGLVNTHPTDSINDADSTYWNQLHYATSHGDFDPDPLEVAEKLIQEASDKEASAKIAKAIAASPNPIHATSVGEDQGMGPIQLGVTYSPEELEELSEMKKKLHELQDQMNTADGKGVRSKQYESQIKNLKAKIDELSNMFTQIFTKGS